jgi:hypothetical protein
VKRGVSRDYWSCGRGQRPAWMIVFNTLLRSFDCVLALLLRLWWIRIATVTTLSSRLFGPFVETTRVRLWQRFLSYLSDSSLLEPFINFQLYSGPPEQLLRHLTLLSLTRLLYCTPRRLACSLYARDVAGKAGSPRCFIGVPGTAPRAWMNTTNCM